MYTKEILLLLSWPITIYLSYLLIRFALKKMDKVIQS